MDIKIRKADYADLDRIMEIFDVARKFMASTGNPNQWINGYPQRELMESEIAEEHCYVCLTCGGNEKIVATFCFIEGPDPTYSYIEDGVYLLPGEVAEQIDTDGMFKQLDLFTMFSDNR